MLYASLALVLVGFWLVLSGHYTVITLTAAVVSVLGTLLLARRMHIVDREGHPAHLALGAITYLPWLMWQIAIAAWDVTRLILNPSLPISPTLIRVKGGQKSTVGLTVYANSITLTPGTISARINGDEILVHAVTREGAEDLGRGAMNARVIKLEGGA